MGIAASAVALLVGLAPQEWKVAFAGPLSGPLASSGRESLDGVKAALEVVESQHGMKRPALVELDDGDEVKKAELAFAAALKQKCDVLVAAATGLTVETYVARARTEGMVLLLVGSSGPAAPSIAADEPVFWLGASTVERAITIGTFLDVPCMSRQPGLVADDTPRGHELAAALERNLAGRFKFAGSLFVKPHAAVPVEGLSKLKESGADRLILSGEPDLVDAAIAALGAAAWKAPLFVDDGMLSGPATLLFGAGAGERRKGTFLLQGFPRFASPPPPELTPIWARDHAGSKEVLQRAQRAFVTTRLFFRAAAAAATPKKAKLPELVALLLDQRYGPEENERPLFDEVHRSARQRWLPFKLGAAGPEQDEPTYYLDPDMGPALRVRSPLLYKAEPNTKVVWFTYGDATSKAVRSIEQDLTALGLITRGYDGEMDRWILDELMARTLGKINRLFLKNEDGTFLPGVSFAISFTTEKPTTLKEHDYWRAVIAGDDPDAGGRAWPGEGRCEIYSTFMRRTIYQPRALDPPLRGEDRRFLDGKYVWGSSSGDNLRLKLIRALIDGYAGSFALTGAHELGHIAGLGHDEESPRSIMNVAEGGGLAETSACWIPGHVEVLERALGRYGATKKK